MGETLEQSSFKLAEEKFEEKCNIKPNLSNVQHLLVVSSIQEGIMIGANWQKNDCVQFINKLEDESFDGWSEEAKSGYLTACMTIKQKYIDGAKWQQERMYSEENMKDFAEYVWKEVKNGRMESMNKFLENFKK